MSMWNWLDPRDLDMSRLLIEKKMDGQYGLAPRKWTAQLDALRELPEVPPEEEAA